MKKLIFTLIAILLLSSVVSAQEDFSARAPGVLNTFQCSTFESTITVKNTGSAASTYYFDVDGTAADWHILSPSSFTLGPGQQMAVQSILDVPCEADGDYWLDTYIYTAFGTEKLIQQDIFVQQAQNLDAFATVFEQVIKPGETAFYNVTIINPAGFTETYTLSLDQFSDDTDLPELTLPGKSSESILIELSPADHTKTGVFDLTLSIETEKTHLIADLGLELEIENHGIASIAPTVNRIRTNFSDNQVELPITNTGDADVRYLLSVQGPEWLSVSPRSLAVEAGKTENFKLLMNPASAVKGTYAVTLFAEVESTGAEYTHTVTVVLKNRDIVDKLFQEYIIYTVSIIVLLILIIVVTVVLTRYYKSDAYKKKQADKLKRKEERAQQKELAKKEKEKRKAQKKLEEEKARREKEREEERFKKQAAKEHEKELRKQFQLIAKKDILEGKKLPSKVMYKLMLVVLIAMLIGMAALYWSSVRSNWQSLILGLLILVVLYVLARVLKAYRVGEKWKGITLAKQLMLLDVNWKEGLSQVSFKVNAPIKNLKTIVKKGKGKQPRYENAKDHVYQYFRAEASAENVDIAYSRFRFKVKKAWLGRNDVRAHDIRLACVSGDSWQTVKPTQTGSDEKYVYYKAEADSLGAFAIVGRTSRKEKKRDASKAVMAMVVLGILGAILLAHVLSDQSIEARGIPIQTIHQNEQGTLDLAKYFKDPDGDALSFTAAPVPNIAITFEGSIAIITPEQDFIGTRVTAFQADDGKGGLARSNPVKLVVKKPGISKFFSMYGMYVIAGILVLIALIAFFTFYDKKK